MAAAKKKKLTQEQMAHQKFLQKMGVTKKQLKARKAERMQQADERRQFNPDTLQSIRQAYDE